MRGVIIMRIRRNRGQRYRLLFPVILILGAAFLATSIGVFGEGNEITGKVMQPIDEVEKNQIYSDCKWEYYEEQNTDVTIVTCPANKYVVAGGCGTSDMTPIGSSMPLFKGPAAKQADSWLCETDGSIERQLRAHANCCKYN
jgi:hypothetical protein